MTATPPRLPARRAFPSWRAFAIAGLVATLAGLALVWRIGAVPPAWYPPCPSHALTGLLCPGCGSARTIHALAHGDIRAACGYNILIVIATPLFAAWAASALWRGLRHNLPPLAPPLGTARVALVFLVVFWIARNLPWWPFTLLAP